MNDPIRGNAADQKRFRLLSVLQVVLVLLLAALILCGLLPGGTVRSLPRPPLLFGLAALLLLNYFVSSRRSALCTCAACGKKVPPREFLRSAPDSFRCPHCGKPYQSAAKPISFD